MACTLLLTLNLKIAGALELSLFCLCAVLLLRPLSLSTLRYRVPFLLLPLGVLLILGLGNAALAFSSLGERALGRPLYADTSQLGSRLLEIWIAFLLISAPWAVTNLAARRAVLLNVLALIAGVASLLLILLAGTGAFVWYL